MKEYNFDEIITQYQAGELPENIVMHDEKNKIFLNKDTGDAFYFDEENDNKTIILKSSFMASKLFYYTECPECKNMNINKTELFQNDIIKCNECEHLYKAEIPYAEVY